MHYLHFDRTIRLGGVQSSLRREKLNLIEILCNLLTQENIFICIGEIIRRM